MACSFSLSSAAPEARAFSCKTTIRSRVHSDNSAPARFSHGFHGLSTVGNKVFHRLRASVATGVNAVVVQVTDQKKHSNPIIVIDNYDSFTYNLCQDDATWRVIGKGRRHGRLFLFDSSTFYLSEKCFGIQDWQRALTSQFHMKDLGTVTYFLGLEVSGSPRGFLISQKKYASEFVAPARLTDSKTVDTPMELNVKYHEDGGAPLVYPTEDRYLYIGELGADFEVYRNDELTVEEIKKKNPRGILISPGPGTPQDSGISLQTVLDLGPEIPLFGVCMGLQCIGEAFGGKIVRSPFGVMHGKSSPVYYDEKGEDGLLAGLPNPFTAGRYHSLVIENDSFSSDMLEITAWTEDGLIMAVRHKKYRHIQGVQFHPESIITTEGKTIVRNFIKLIERKEAESP